MSDDLATRMNEIIEAYCFDTTLRRPLTMILRGENPKQALALLLARARAAKIALEVDPNSSWDKMTAELIAEYVMYNDLPETGTCPVCIWAWADDEWRLFNEDGLPFDITADTDEEAADVLKKVAGK